MQLITAILYDPSTLVTVSTATLTAMTAFDTTNLRLTFTVPTHGLVRAVIRVPSVGASALAYTLLGVLEGATIIGRGLPATRLANNAAIPSHNVLDIIIPNLTPGPAVWDAAYAVEDEVASTAFKYGGPDTAIINDAYGAFSFEVWDPAPNPTNFSEIAIDASGNFIAKSSRPTGRP